ncbi:hypothetical protein FPCIR_10988 [Fusarium pseudocircinatum]|uniref:Uncharacterized protein n=1 Tax=Fusarium pseudocircinatum TaxID=56676 RepID=A0A8H5NUZ9_9HYPO|nr:hypothetical protein FPCIR_10988 [Fusarium pseudocircinatum]
MCEFNDEEISHDPNPFSTVPPPSGPSGPSGSSEPQDSITANPVPKQSWEAGPTPEHDNPQKRKGATVTGEPEELENSPSAKRLQPEQHSIPTPVKTPSGTEAHQHSSSPLQHSDLDMPGPSAPAERRDASPRRYPSPSFHHTPRPVRDIANSTHTRISQQSTQERHLSQGLEQRQDEQGIPDQGVSGPSREPENVASTLITLEHYGKALILSLEEVDEQYREQLVQLVLARPQDQEICSAEGLCLYHDEEIKKAQKEHKRYWIKINWPQVTSGEGAGRTAHVYHKFFPKMVGDPSKVGLMAREWLRRRGHVSTVRMYDNLLKIKSKEPGDALAQLWRDECSQSMWHLEERACGLSDILNMGDDYEEE